MAEIVFDTDRLIAAVELLNNTNHTKEATMVSRLLEYVEKAEKLHTATEDILIAVDEYDNMLIDETELNDRLTTIACKAKPSLSVVTGSSMQICDTDLLKEAISEKNTGTRIMYKTDTEKKLEQALAEAITRMLSEGSESIDG